MQNDPIFTTYHTHTLSNGLRIVHLPSLSPVTYCGFAVDAGTRDERPDEQGMAHFVEHTLFKGTQRRKAWHILNRMENVGGDLNAYTNKEETVVYAAFLNEHLTRAAELLTDIVFHSTFPSQELAKETEVVIDEIQSYEDTPSELIFDDFEDLIFQGHPLGHNILGTPEQLKSFTSEKVKAFVERYYHPGNMVFFVLGNYPFARIVKLMERLAGAEPARPSCSERQNPSPYEPRQLLVEKETHQNHIMIGARGYDAHNPKRTALYLLNNMLGGPGMNSRLNLSLRERRGLVYTVESNLTAYTDTGTFCIYLGCDDADRRRCIQLVTKELNLLCQRPLTSAHLAAAKKQLIGQIGVASDNNENMALSMAKTFLHYNRYELPQAVCRRVEALTAAELYEVANEMFRPEYLSTLIYAPTEE